LVRAGPNGRGLKKAEEVSIRPMRVATAMRQ
jgi:hypothetical protein